MFGGWRMAATAAVLGCMGGSGGGTALAEVPQPPPTERRAVVETLHGVEVKDPYRWLEGDAEGRVTPEVAAWTDAQNAYTRAMLDGLPGRAELESRLRALLTVGSVSAPRARGNRYFYSRREGSASQASVLMREGVRGADRVLLDPAVIDPSGLTTIAFFSPAPCGRLMAFGLYRAGDENTTAYVLDVDRGRWLADELPGKVGGVDWLPDSASFIYRRLADVKNPYSGQVVFHEVGTHVRQDRVLFEQYKDGPLATTWGPGGYLSEDGRWLILSYWTSTASNDLWVADFDQWRRTGELVKRAIAEGLPATFAGGPIVGDTLYMRTTLDAPNGRIVAVDLHRPDQRSWRDVVPERSDVVIDGVSAGRGVLVVSGQRRAMTVLERYGLDGTPLGEIGLGGPASASVTTQFDRTEAFVWVSGFERPPAVYRIDLTDPKLASAGGEFELWERLPFPVDTSQLESKQVTYTSRDGTPVTMFLVHRRGVELNGNNPVLLSGYGGFRIPTLPGFRATAIPFLEDGGVLALPNLRGGNEYGEAWHRAGKLENKTNVFDDFEAAAEWLIASGYTRPERLAIQGGSNGGLLVGAAVTRRPELFAAAICQVPLLDMLRYQHFLMARFWVPEYGSSEDPVQFRWLLGYSPYHNAREGVRYPAMLITAGENDARTHPMHARKFAALMQHLTSGGENGAGGGPVLLWVDRDAGHGAGKPLELVLRDVVDQQLFVRWRLGMR